MHAKKRSRMWLLIVVLYLTLGDLARADKCKKMLRSMFFDRCGYRSKRSPIMDVLNPASDFATEVVGSHTRKRQIMSIREIILSSSVPMYDIGYPAIPSYARYDSAPVVPPDPTIRLQTPQPLPPESGSDLGFDMSYEEMIELFEEIYERMPRTARARPKEEIQKELFPLFQDCCKNENRCLARKEHLSYCPS